jgi:hypothetical protein
MRQGRAALSLVLCAFISESFGCTSIVETTPPPLKTNMEFKRDLYNGKGCLEYSWVPEAKRRLVQLNAGTREGAGQGPVATEASHVQVYALTNGQYSLKDWQFPPGPPHSSPVAGATIEVKEIEAVGTVFYQDRSSATDRKALVPMPVTCPAGPEKVSIADPEITRLDPPTIARGGAATVTVIGTNFTRDSVVLIDGANPATQYVSSSTLEAELTADDTARQGKRGVKVHGAKNGTTSNEVILTVE